MEREKFGSRLGFILISAGCAIGLGNVWRFPYIVGKYGGAAFVLIYLAFLLILGLPVMVAEFAVGRASQKSAACSFDVLEPKGTKWHLYKYGAIAGNYLLMMFYTTIAGWMILYFVKMATGQFDGLNSDQVGEAFSHMLGQPVLMTVFMAIAVLLCFGICAKGLQKGVERITKVMMVCLLSLMVVLAVRSVLLPGGQEGLKFYLYPDFGKVKEAGIGGLCCDGTGILYAQYRNRGTGYLWKLHWKRACPDRRGSQHLCAGYLCGTDVRTDHFSVLFCLQCAAGQRPEPDLYHTAECI